MRKYSIIIPVYNRPDELSELLTCLVKQTFTHFEVIIIEDGSRVKCEEVVKSFNSQLEIQYFYKENSGQGFARNYGFERAQGDYFIIFDSDALIEPNYLAIVDNRLNTHYTDLYGGPDTDHPSFKPIQKAISYSMTSLFTTGGIRGKKNNLGGTFHPRSFNMGISRAVWERTGGFLISRMGEDIIFSITALRMGFKSALIPEAFIYHKRRTGFGAFFRQLVFFGRARINIARFYPDELKLVHTFPFLFTLGCFSIPFLWFIHPWLFQTGIAFLIIYSTLLFIDAARQSKSIKVGLLCIIAAFVQLFGYGFGFAREGVKRLMEPKTHRETGAALEYPS
ncbi:glycosyltransferase [Runella slithyformis]|uniref:Glycosyl transferase family 2 n=1 Tax=Runella slithyformis (strain ATCC 29530 / DSM 19594 / LMG 11500 / NCIMB 11436 / LSU 4) TaxID=761193 RepID=A0A7U4E711_RUNSL|nr:glycosyltransferase [Runella slithyformis]AEI49884.1 glycosyl transferase family 2 [Runella slithyformis DSM 19594]